jgi:hypothetical protein
MLSTEVVASTPVEESGSSSAARSQDSLERENAVLRRQLLDVLDERTGSTSSLVDALHMPPAPYRVDLCCEGFWDGLYRARCGFRVIGYYDTHQEAWDRACLDYAVMNHRIRPSETHRGAVSDFRSPAAC